MEKKKGKIKSVFYNRTFQGKNKAQYTVYDVIMEDGAYGELTATTENSNNYVVGYEFEYTLESFLYQNETKWRIKKVYEENKSFSGKPRGRGEDPGRQQSIIRQSSIKAAVDLVVANKIDIKQMFPTAEKIEEWVNRK